MSPAPPAIVLLAAVPMAAMAQGASRAMDHLERYMRPPRVCSINALTYSNAIGGAQWLSFSEGGAASPTVTANFAAGPDGAATAARLQWTSSAGTSIRGRWSLSTRDAVAYIWSAYVKSNAGEVTLYIGDWNASDGNKCSKTACRVGPARYTRCVHRFVADQTTTGDHQLWLGYMDGRGCASTGGVQAADVSAVGAQAEAGATAGPFSPTEATAAGRCIDLLRPSSWGLL